MVFSNAALQWVGDHASLLPALLGRVALGGALAVQMPAYDNPANRVLREMARDWKIEAREWEASHSLDFYYETLRPHTERLDLWTTEYLQVMADVAAIVEWYKGTALRPYLEAVESGGSASWASSRRWLREAYPASCRRAGCYFLLDAYSWLRTWGEPATLLCATVPAASGGEHRPGGAWAARRANCTSTSK
ncbi:MAG: hypothetical protein R2724_10545 [Bryobacterales bacterium]